MNNFTMNNFTRLFYLVFFSVISGLLSSCGSEDKGVNKQVDTLNVNYYEDIGQWRVPKPILPNTKKRNYVSRPVVKVINNKVAIAYSAKDSINLTYGSKDFVIDKNGASKRVWLFTDKYHKQIYVLWWKKTLQGKKLYFSSSSDNGESFSKGVVINSYGGVLKQIDLVADGKGHVSVVYYDERNPPYRVYVNTSSDNGLTWKKSDIRLDNDVNTIKKLLENGKEVPVNYAMTPQVELLDTGAIVAVWQQRKRIENSFVTQIVSRLSRDKGETWLPEKVVYETHRPDIVEIALTSKGNNVVVVAAYPVMGLLGFIATDDVKQANEKLNWRSLGAVPNTEKSKEISWLKPAMTDNQFKVAYIIRNKTYKKYAIEVATLNIASGDKWEKDVFRLDRDKNQSVETKAAYVDLKALPTGEFVAVWEDYRALIPMLMLDYTSEKGSRWQSKAKALTREGLSIARLPELHPSDKKLHVVFEWDILKDKKLPNMSKIDFDIDSLSGGLLNVTSAPLPKFSKKQKKEKLFKRARELMSLRVSDKWDKTWTFMDPVYQLVTNKRSWLSNIGNINYEKGEVKRVTVDGRFGTADVEFSISMKQQFMQGEVIEPTPSKKTSSIQKWLWFYDEWYFYPSNSFMPHLLY